ncbi:hypothetical protein TNIN_440381 [Trichonephila inaurata madagascariensis]|uniref:Sushi domain-containing protein n=1 Tax=Trichonephila inaurata madagascariensis TaxID=2747483 RepID=A0A8X6YNZ9_9ARAC|nr:hypothetical protein TNIN_440381 [Trichonephila inaurata madagascariensis]
MECLTDFQWSKPPDCTCANPNVSEPIELITKCDAIPKIGKCFVRCKIGYDMEGINYTTCQNNAARLYFPKTQKFPQPIELITKGGDAISKNWEKALSVVKNGYDMKGINYTTCQKNGKWGAFPACQKVSCPELVLSSSVLKVNGECSGKLFEDECLVTCREGGQLIGEAKIKCEYTGVWSSLPQCTCPVPNSSKRSFLKIV